MPFDKHLTRVPVKRDIDSDDEASSSEQQCMWLVCPLEETLSATDPTFKEICAMLSSGDPEKEAEAVLAHHQVQVLGIFSTGNRTPQNSIGIVGSSIVVVFPRWVRRHRRNPPSGKTCLLVLGRNLQSVLIFGFFIFGGWHI